MKLRLTRFKYFWNINFNGYTPVGWIWPPYKTDPKLILISSNLDPNKPWILVKNKVLIRPKQALVNSWNNKNKTLKLILYAAVRREEEKKIIQVWHKVYL
jgi:hypothetical protein